jgi:hypothetical protein
MSAPATQRCEGRTQGDPDAFSPRALLPTCQMRRVQRKIMRAVLTDSHIWTIPSRRFRLCAQAGTGAVVTCSEAWVTLRQARSHKACYISALALTFPKAHSTTRMMMISWAARMYHSSMT